MTGGSFGGSDPPGGGGHTGGICYELEHLAKFEIIFETALGFELGVEGCLLLEKISYKNLVSVSPFNPQALTELEKIHGPIVKKHYEEGLVYMWNKNRHSHGGFIHREPNQKYNLVVGRLTFSRSGFFFQLLCEEPSGATVCTDLTLKAFARTVTIPFEIFETQVLQILSLFPRREQDRDFVIGKFYLSVFNRFLRFCS
jgi:hypothetical protein